MLIACLSRLLRCCDSTSSYHLSPPYDLRHRPALGYRHPADRPPGFESDITRTLTHHRDRRIFIGFSKTFAIGADHTSRQLSVVIRYVQSLEVFVLSSVWTELIVSRFHLLIIDLISHRYWNRVSSCQSFRIRNDTLRLHHNRVSQLYDSIQNHLNVPAPTPLDPSHHRTSTYPTYLTVVSDLCRLCLRSSAPICFCLQNTQDTPVGDHLSTA